MPIADVNRHTDSHLPEAIDMRIGERIKELRERAGLNQTQLAKRVGIKQGSLSDIETGETKAPSAELIWRISQALSTSVRYLVTGRGSPDVSLPEDPSEADLIASLRQLAPSSRAALLAFSRALLEHEGKQTEERHTKQDPGKTPGKKGGPRKIA